MRTCSVNECSGKHKAMGLCNKHYLRLNRNLPVEIKSRRDKTQKERFEEKINKTKNCWLWTGGKVTGGYGSFKIDGEKILAHRFSYLQYVGAIPDGMNVCHSCDVPACVNPDHLWIGTQQDNVDDMINKGRARYQSCLCA